MCLDDCSKKLIKCQNRTYCSKLWPKKSLKMNFFSIVFEVELYPKEQQTTHDSGQKLYLTLTETSENEFRISARTKPLSIIKGLRQGISTFLGQFFTKYKIKVPLRRKFVGLIPPTSVAEYRVVSMFTQKTEQKTVHPNISQLQNCVKCVRHY